jgi:hypothetical protein
VIVSFGPLPGRTSSARWIAADRSSIERLAVRHRGDEAREVRRDERGEGAPAELAEPLDVGRELDELILRVLQGGSGRAVALEGQLGPKGRARRVGHRRDDAGGSDRDHGDDQEPDDREGRAPEGPAHRAAS